MRVIDVVIADDEPLAREGIELMLRADPEVKIVASCGDGKSALAAIRAEKPDLVFLDVQMPKFSGLEVFEQLTPSERPTVVFVTAHDDYAVKAFDMCATDYLLKPFRDVRFKAALARAKEQVRRADLDELQRKARELLDHLGRVGAGQAVAPETRRTAPASARLVFKINGAHVFVASDDVVWVEAQGETVKLKAGNDLHTVRESLSDVEKRLDPDRFVRIHRSFIVNRRCIRKITPTLYGDHDVLMDEGTKVRLSRTFRDRLKLLLELPKV
jgi:two-component system LytT family response regulator